jgi:lycopene beta-cyclase
LVPGAAGLQLMLGLLHDPERQNESILVIDPDEKTQNDRTWCYWEEDGGKYDAVIHKAWEQGKFITKEKEIALGMEKYQYKMIRSVELL